MNDPQPTYLPHKTDQVLWIGNKQTLNYLNYFIPALLR